MVEVREVVRLWSQGESLRSISRLTGLDRKTVRRYVKAARLRIGAWLFVKARSFFPLIPGLRGQPAADLPVESRFSTDWPSNSFEPGVREARRQRSAHTDPFGPQART
jgi:hypothetical protein